MVTQLLTIGLTNAALACALAAIVWLVLRWQRNMHVAAILWLFVLVKLVTPPILSYSIEKTAPDSSISVPVNPPLAPHSTDRLEIESTLFDRPLTTDLTSVDEFAGQSEQQRVSSFENTTTEIIPIVEGRKSPKEIESSVIDWQSWAMFVFSPPIVAMVWLGGTMVTALWLVFNGLRFYRLIHHHQITEQDTEMNRLLEQLCRRYHIRKTPRLRVLDARVSPLLWAWFDGTTLVVPRSLVETLSPNQMELLLTHELAHLNRRDHLIRWLEFVVQSLFWWLPLVPWVRWHMHSAQEECCDAFVNQHFPESSVDYCEMLFTTARWLQGTQSSPVWASELGSSSGLKQRIQVMLNQKISQPISPRAVVMCVMLGMVSCAMSIHWVQARETSVPVLQEEQAVEATKPTVEGTNSTKDTEFSITDMKGNAVPTGTLNLRGVNGNGHFFEKKIPIQQGRAKFRFERSDLTELLVSITAPQFQNYHREYEPEGTERVFSVARKYEFKLKQGITLGGTIVESQGRPLEGVRVYYSIRARTRNDGGVDWAGGWLTTDAAGKWSTSNISPQFNSNGGLKLQYIHITHEFQSQKYLSHKLSPIMSVLSEQEKGPRFLTSMIQKTPHLAGTVVNPKGEPVKDAVVDIINWESEWERVNRGLIIKTDEKGAFRIPKPPKGECNLRFRHPQWRWQNVAVTTPTVKPVNVVMQKGKRIEFRAIDSEGKPIKGMKFIPGLPDTEFHGLTDSEGRWVWDNAPDKVLHYQIYRSGYLSQPPGTAYGPDDSPITLTFRKSIPVIATVLDAESGEPIREYRLFDGAHFKVNKRESWGWSQQTSQTMRPVKGSWLEGMENDQVGTFIEPGRFMTRLGTLDRIVQYRVQADGYLPQLSCQLDAAILPDQPVRLEFRLQKNKRLQRTVFQPDGKPAVDAYVATKFSLNQRFYPLGVVNGVPDQKKRTAPSTLLRSDANGRFTLPIHNNPFVCVITHETGYLEIKDCELAGKEELKLKPWSTLTGTVFVKGKPAAGVKVKWYLSREFGGDDPEFPSIVYSLSGVTDEAGQYRFSKGVAGTGSINCFYESSRESESKSTKGFRPGWNRLPVKLVSGEAVQQDIGQVGADIIGRVIIPKGLEIDSSYGGEIQLSRKLPTFENGYEQWESHQATIRKDGTFRCFNMRPGLYKGAVTLHQLTFDRYWYFKEGPHRQTYQKSIQIAQDLFKGKSFTDPIDLGEIKVDTIKR